MSVCLHKQGDVLLRMPLSDRSTSGGCRERPAPSTRIDGPVTAGQPGERTPRERESNMERIAVIGELNKRSGDLLQGLYSPLCQRNHTPIFRTDLRTAEMAKYAHNLFNAAKISFTNETWLVSKELGIDGNQVMALVAQSAEGMWNPRYGIRGGFPYSGNCLPKDIEAFVNLARDLGWPTPLLEAAIAVNQRTREAAGRRPALIESITSAAS